VAVAEDPVAADAVRRLDAVERDPGLVQGLRGGDAGRSGADQADGGQVARCGHDASLPEDDGGVKFVLTGCRAAPGAMRRRLHAARRGAGAARCGAYSSPSTSRAARSPARTAPSM